MEFFVCCLGRVTYAWCGLFLGVGSTLYIVHPNFHISIPRQTSRAFGFPVKKFLLLVIVLPPMREFGNISDPKAQTFPHTRYHWPPVNCFKNSVWLVRIFPFRIFYQLYLWYFFSYHFVDDTVDHPVVWQANLNCCFLVEVLCWLLSLLPYLSYPHSNHFVKSYQTFHSPLDFTPSLYWRVSIWESIFPTTAGAW